MLCSMLRPRGRVVQWLDQVPGEAVSGSRGGRGQYKSAEEDIYRRACGGSKVARGGEGVDDQKEASHRAGGAGMTGQPSLSDQMAFPCGH